MSAGRTILKTLCAAAAALTVCAGSVAAVAPALAADGGAATATADGATDSTVARLPGAPTITNHDHEGIDRVELFWKAPQDKGEPAFTGFVATATPRDGGDAVTAYFGKRERSGMVTGLRSATIYDITLAAVNANGAGAASNAVTITTLAGGSGDGGSGDSGDGDDSGDSGNATKLADVTLRWGVNDETNSAAFFGGCNFLSAGVAANTGGSKTWDESLYKASDGKVSIQKPDANGEWTEATWASKCLTRDGRNVTMGKRADGRSINTESQVVLAGGTGTVKSDGTTTISWKGSWTVAYYGGMTYWSVTDPTLTLAADGTGALTATASGYGADMNDASKWLTLEPQEIHLADFTGGNAVDVTKALDDHGFTATPDYLGVAVNASGDHGSQAVKSDANAAYWGSFPQSFVDFQLKTGQSAYWYTSDSARDFAKPALPVSVQYDASYQVSAGEGSPDAGTAAGGAASASGSGSSTGSRSGGSGVTGKTATGATGSGARANGTGTAGAVSGDGADAAGDDADGGVADDVAADSADSGDAGTLLVADNARTIAVGSGSVAVASGLPLVAGWLIRRRLGLDAAAELDRRLGL